jgi:hypothetical protein
MAAGEAFKKIVVVDDDTPDTRDLLDVGDLLRRSIQSIIGDDNEVPIRKEQLVAKSVAQFLDYIGVDTTPRRGGPDTVANLLKRYGDKPMDIIEIAKAAERGDTTGLAGVMSSAEYMGEINRRAAAIRKPGESQSQAFARFTLDERHGGQFPDGPLLLKAAMRHAADVDPNIRAVHRPDPVTTAPSTSDDIIADHIMPRLDKMRLDGETTDQVITRWAESDPEAGLLMKAAGYKMPEAVAAVRKARGFPEASLEPRVIATGEDIASDPNSMDRAAEIAQVMAIRPWMTVTQAAVYVERMRQAVQRANRRGGEYGRDETLTRLSDSYAPDMSSPGRQNHSRGGSSPGRP